MARKPRINSFDIIPTQCSRYFFPSSHWLELRNCPVSRHSPEIKKHFISKDDAICNFQETSECEPSTNAHISCLSHKLQYATRIYIAKYSCLAHVPLLPLPFICSYAIHTFMPQRTITIYVARLSCEPTCQCDLMHNLFRLIRSEASELCVINFGGWPPLT